jgi:hypothetical protein
MSTSKIIALIAVMGLALAATAIDSAVAGEKVEQKVHSVFHYFKAEAAKIGDVPGHVVGVVQGNGLTFPEKDEPGAYSIQTVFDFINGSGPHWGYSMATWEDGSTTVIKFKGTTTATQGGKVSVFKGTYTYIKGTGRYEGIKGDGSYSGRRIAPITGEPFIYTDGTETYTLP